jgi:hypothetical protein
MRRRLLRATCGIAMLIALALAGIVIPIRSGLQRASDNAASRFPGDRTHALIRVVDCADCTLEHRNLAVWALGQMVEKSSLVVLRKHFDGHPCTHATRVCQYELGKAIRMIETADRRTGPVWRLVAGWHQPWR